MVSIAIAVLSLTEGPMPLRPTSLSDKTLHSLAYVLQAVTLLWALWRSYRPGWRGALLTFAYTIMLGGLMEVLQATYTRTRIGEWLDLAADAIGAVAGVALTYTILVLIDRHRTCKQN